MRRTRIVKVLLAVLVLGFLIVFLVRSVFLGHSDSSLPEPVHLTDAQLVGTWSSPSGGSLAIRQDGTFSAVNVCGFGATADGVGSDSGSWKTSSGEWLSIATGQQTGGVSFTGKISSAELDEGVAAKSDVLWMFIGPPDENTGTCKLHLDAH